MLMVSQKLKLLIISAIMKRFLIQNAFSLVEMKVRTFHRLIIIIMQSNYFFKITGTMYLDAGEHVYNFEMQLPLDLPSTYDGQHGHIIYYANVIVIIPWGSDKDFEDRFYVFRDLDLNRFPSLRVIHSTYSSINY